MNTNLNPNFRHISFDKIYTGKYRLRNYQKNNQQKKRTHQKHMFFFLVLFFIFRGYYDQAQLSSFVVLIDSNNS